MRITAKIEFIFISILLFAACEKQENTRELYEINYDDSENWLAFPENTDKPIDVFYVYPSVWHKSNSDKLNTAKINDSQMHAAAKIVLAQQASAFETVGNIYAPYYRQADPVYALSLPPTDRDLFIGGIPASDVEAAFAHYIKYENNKRPFLLAGHSQGSQTLLFLLSGYLKNNPEVYKRMVAAYVIGYSVTTDYLQQNPHLKFAKGADDTGVIISYNTEAPNINVTNPVLLENSRCINPINWSREETLAPASDNMGTLVIDTLGQVIKTKEMNYANAQINKTRGVVTCSSADAKNLHRKIGVLPEGVYHLYDYSFYYFNLRANAESRIQKYMEKNN
jgi:hypothetical protein